jgi:hypothetical protein
LEVARAVSEDAQINPCQNRWYRTLDPSIRRGNWSPEEDAQLRVAVDLYGNAWMEVASVIPGRNNEQCRDRWGERLNPKVPRGKWTAEEDARLLSAVDEFGVKGWKEVSERVGTGRRDNAVSPVHHIYTESTLTQNKVPKPLRRAKRPGQLGHYLWHRWGTDGGLCYQKAVIFQAEAT